MVLSARCHTPRTAPRTLHTAHHALHTGPHHARRHHTAQRVLEGCFTAFAMPTLLAPHVPPAFWERSATGAIARTPNGRTSGADVPSASYGGGGMPELLRVGALLRPPSPRDQPRPPQPAASGGAASFASPSSSSASCVALLDVEPSALANFSALHGVKEFDRARLTGALASAPMHPLVGDSWWRCLKMLRHNRCAAVC